MIRNLLMLCLLGAGAAHASDMIALRYLDQDPGAAPYLTRILVTPGFLRMDDGQDGSDFILLDRRRKKVINVLRGSNMAMVFTPGPLPDKPADWMSRLETRPKGHGTQHFRLSVKGVVCSEGVVARQAAPDAARAMSELKSVLAATQYRVWEESPRELQYDCDLANQVWDAGAILTLGLPLEEREFSGRSRQLESETRLPLQPGLFRVPDGMTEISAPS